MFPYTGNSKVYAHEVVVRPLEGGGVQYVSNRKIGQESVRVVDLTRLCYLQMFMSDKIDMVISVALLPAALLSAPILVAKKYVLSTVSI